MDDTITTIYCLCDEFLKAFHHEDDPQVRLTTAEVITVPLVASTFFGGNIDKTRRFFHEYGYMPAMISKSHLNRRLHIIEPSMWWALFWLLAELFKDEERNPQQTYVVDSLPVRWRSCWLPRHRLRNYLPGAGGNRGGYCRPSVQPDHGSMGRYHFGT